MTKQERYTQRTTSSQDTGPSNEHCTRDKMRQDGERGVMTQREVISEIGKGRWMTKGRQEGCHETTVRGQTWLESFSGIEQGNVPSVQRVCQPGWDGDCVIWPRLLFAVLLCLVQETSGQGKMDSSEGLQFYDESKSWSNSKGTQLRGIGLSE